MSITNLGSATKRLVSTNYWTHESAKSRFMDVALLAYTVVTFKHTISGVYDFKPQELYYVVMVLLPISMVLQITHGILDIIVYQKKRNISAKESYDNNEETNEKETNATNTKAIKTLELVHTIFVFVIMLLTIFIEAFVGENIDAL